MNGIAPGGRSKISFKATGSQPVSLPASRWIPQLTIVLIVIGGATLRNLGMSAGWIPELRALCPLGATQAIISAFDPATAIEWSRLTVPAGVLLVTVILGPVFCGRLCPLGSVQEWVGRVGKRILGSRYNRPVPGDRVLGNLRYVVLAVIVATALGFVVIETDLFNPSLALVHVWTSVVPPTAVLLLATTLVASLFVERPWCRWLCPYGVLLGTVAKISPWTIRRNAVTCIDCGRCDRACPLAIGVRTAAAVRDNRCNRCERCVQACPVPDALALRRSTVETNRSGTNRSGTNQVGTNHVGRNRIGSGAGVSAATLLLFFTPLLLSWIANTAEARVAGEATLLPAAEKESADQQPGRLHPEDISPMMTLRDLSETARLPHGELMELLQLPDTIDPELMLIDIEEEPGLDHVTVGYIRSIFAGGEQ